MLKLTAQIKVTKNFSGHSKFSFWHEIEVGDIILVTEKLTNQVDYTPTIRFDNLRTREFFIDSRNTACNYLKNLEFDVVNVI